MAVTDVVFNVSYNIANPQAIEGQKKSAEELGGILEKLSAKRLKLIDERSAATSVQAIKDITKEISAAEREMGKLTQTTSYFGRIAKEAQGVFAGMVGFAAIQAAGRAFLDLGKNIVMAATEIESLESRFTVLLKSSTKAQTLIRQATELAIVSPFTQSAVLEGAQTLLASGINANSLLSTLRQVAEVSGASETTFQRLIVNVAQINALGKLQGGEIRQFAQNGIPLMAALQKQLGKTSAEVTKMAEKGQISAKAFNKALASLSAEGGLFEGAMEKAASTVEGKYSTLKDRIQLTFQQIGKAFLPAIHSFLDAANAFLKGLTPEKVQAFVNVIINLSGWVITLGKGLLYLGALWATQRVLILAYTGAVIILNAVQTAYNAVLVTTGFRLSAQKLAAIAAASSMGALTTATTANTVATTASTTAIGLWRTSLALLAAPIGLAIAAIAGISYVLHKVNEDYLESIRVANEFHDKTIEKFQDLSNRINLAVDAIKGLDPTALGIDVEEAFAQLDAKKVIGDPAAFKTRRAEVVKEVDALQKELEIIAERQKKGNIKSTTFLGITLREEKAITVKVTKEEREAKIKELTKFRQESEVTRLEGFKDEMKLQRLRSVELARLNAENMRNANRGINIDSSSELDRIDAQLGVLATKRINLIKDNKDLLRETALLRIVPDAVTDSGKAEHIAKLRRDLLVADTKAIEDNIRAMGRQTREFLQQQVDLEAAQAGRFTRIMELEQEFATEHQKTLEDAAEREIVANKKLTDDLLKERRQLAQAAVIKGEDSEAPERRIKEIERIGRLATQAERAAAFARLKGRADLIAHLIALDQNYAEEQVKIMEAQQADLLAIFFRTLERENIILAKELQATIDATKKIGEETNALFAEMEVERSQRAGSMFRSDEEAQLNALKVRAQNRLNVLLTSKENEGALTRKIEQLQVDKVNANYKFEQDRLAVIQRGAFQDELDALDKNLKVKMKTIEGDEEKQIALRTKFNADVKKLELDAFRESLDAEIGFMDKRNALRQKDADKKLRDRQSEIARQALFPGLVEDVRGFGTTGRGMQLIGQMKANDENIGELQALADKIQNAELGTMKNKAGALIITEEEKKAELKRISELIGKLRDLNQEHERSFKDERAERRRKNFMTIADGIQQITSSITSGMRALYAANEQFFANAANRQKTKIEDVKNTLIAAQTAGNANLAKINAEQLQLEEARLDQLNKIREEYVRKQQALAIIELIANSTIAIAKAAAQGGLAAPFTIAATLIALAVGLAQAKAQAAAAVAGFKEGGYTGDGGNTQAAGVVHKREFVFTAEKTAQNRKEFEAIHSGRFDLKERLAKASLADTLLNSSLRMRADIAERVIIVKDNRFDELRRLFELGFSKFASKGLPSNHISVRNTIKGNDLAQIVVNEQKADARRRK